MKQVSVEHEKKIETLQQEYLKALENVRRKSGGVNKKEYQAAKKKADEIAEKIRKLKAEKVTRTKLNHTPLKK